VVSELNHATVAGRESDLRKGKVLIGTSGWNYKHWSNGVFYPEGLRPAKWLHHYCQYFSTVELNYSFYRLPKRETFEKWYGATPSGFVLAVKANRFITHVKRLKDVEQTVPNFLANASALKEKLGPVLFQFPASFHADEDRLKRLLRYWSSQDIVPGARAAFEFRHESWFTDDVLRLLTDANAAVCLADWPELDREPETTADFVYVRRHGSQRPYTGSYSRNELEKDAGPIRRWSAKGKDVYAYFNNDAFGWALENARTLQELVMN